MNRHDFTKRLLDAAFDLRERIEEANRRQGAARLERLEKADEMKNGGACSWPRPSRRPPRRERPGYQVQSHQSGMKKRCAEFALHNFSATLAAR